MINFSELFFLLVFLADEVDRQLVGLEVCSFRDRRFSCWLLLLHAFGSLPTRRLNMETPSFLAKLLCVGLLHKTRLHLNLRRGRQLLRLWGRSNCLRVRLLYQFVLSVFLHEILILGQVVMFPKHPD